ncbi:hypothetical protein ACM25O_18705 [Sulfitobacter pontiacus]
MRLLPAKGAPRRPPGGCPVIASGIAVGMLLAFTLNHNIRPRPSRARARRRRCGLIPEGQGQGRSTAEAMLARGWRG